MIRNLIIGSEGFIGKPFCKYLEGQGEEVVHFDVKRGKNEDARLVKIDLKKIDRVYFLAWDVGG
jgi:nucleoside-diphosphate-sugar epimerase